MKKRVFSLFMFVLILFSLTIISGAESLGTFPQNSVVSLQQVCDNCTFVNLTSVSYPNGTTQTFDLAMTKVKNDYNFTFTTTNLVGPYSYNTCGDQDGNNVCENIPFRINPLGEDLTLAGAILYIFLTIFLFLLFIFALWLNIVLPLGNQRNEKGNINKIIKLKYIKIGMIPVTYALFNWFLNLLVNISNKLIPGFTVYSGMLGFLFTASMSLAYPVFIASLVWFMWVWIVDFNWNKKIKSFGEVIEKI